MMKRDLEFAQKFELPVHVVVEAPEGESLGFTGNGTSVESGFLTGLPTSEAKAKITDWLENGKGKRTINFKLRDWLFSRQRYWGEPFPIVCGAMAGTRRLPRANCRCCRLSWMITSPPPRAIRHWRARPIG